MSVTKENYTRRFRKNKTEEEIMKGLAKALKAYIASDRIDYQSLIIKEYLLPSQMLHWRKYPKVAEMHANFEAIRLARFNEALTSDNELNASKLIWYAKVALKQVSEEVMVKIKSDEKIVHDTINIGFKDEQ